jgi:phosphatidylglycerol:prolipoprotein diacylglycerol transferase
MKKELIKTLGLALGAGLAFFFVIYFLLSKIFVGDVEMSQALHLGRVTIQYYGVILAVAALSGYVLAMYRRKIYGINETQADNIIFLVIVAGFVGARLYHVISQFGYYSQHLGQIFSVWNGGLGIYGVMIGGVIALVWYTRKHKGLSLWTLLDWLVPSVVLGQVIGRFGNFVNYELYGSATNLPWKMFVPVEFRLAPYQLTQFFHPLFLYESAGSLVILILLLRLKLRPGALFLLWLFLYNVLRFFLEQFRVGSIIYGGIRVNAIVSLLIAIGAAAVYIKYVKPNPSNN